MRFIKANKTATEWLNCGRAKLFSTTSNIFDVEGAELYKARFYKQDIEAYRIAHGTRKAVAIYDLKTCFLIPLYKKSIWVSKDIKWFFGGTQRAEALHLWDLKRHVVYSFVRSRKFSDPSRCRQRKIREKINERKNLYENGVMQRKT